MKRKSMRLRFMLTLHALMKYSDKNHRLNAALLNKQHLPQELDFKATRAYAETISALKEYGLDIRSVGRGRYSGAWIENRPLTDQILNELSFAVTSNPYVSKDKAEELLGSLAPFVTIYQEPILKSCLVRATDRWLPSNFLRAYTVICEAIRNGRRIRYRSFWAETHGARNKYALFAPKYIYQNDERFFALGYNCTEKKVGSLDIMDIVEVEIARRYKRSEESRIHAILDNLRLEDINEQPFPILFGN